MKTILIIFALFIAFSCLEAHQLTRFKSAKCLVLDPTALSVEYCKVRVYSRNSSTLNIGLTVKRPLGKPLLVSCFKVRDSSSRQLFQAKVSVSYRYGTVSREIINVPPVEWCGIMDGIDKHPYIKMAVDVLSESAPGLFQKCPFSVVCKIYFISALNMLENLKF